MSNSIFEEEFSELTDSFQGLKALKTSLLQALPKRGMNHFKG